MKVSSGKLSNEINKLWGYLIKSGGLVMPDGKYWAPDLKTLKKYIINSQIYKYNYNLEWMDCDDFALLLHSDIIKRRYEKIIKNKFEKERRLPISFGQVWLTKVKGENTAHAINICYTSDNGIMLIEPQTNDIWKAHKKKDKPFFIRI
jgi:hypothetical protein